MERPKTFSSRKAPRLWRCIKQQKPAPSNHLERKSRPTFSSCDFPSYIFFSLQLIQTEVDSLIGSLRDEKDKNINLDQHFALSTSNVICNLLMSVRFSRDDPKFAKFNYMIEEGMKLFGQLYTVDYIPITQYLPTMRSAKDKIKVNRREMFEFYKEIIDDHRKTFDRDNIRDVLDTYLLEIENAKLNNTEHLLFEGRDPDNQIMQVISLA